MTALRATGLSIGEIAKRLGVGKGPVHRLLVGTSATVDSGLPHAVRT